MLKEVTNKKDKALGIKRFRVENVELVIRHFGEEDEELVIRFRGESAIASSFCDRSKLLDSLTEIVKFANSYQALNSISSDGEFMVSTTAKQQESPRNNYQIPEPKPKSLKEHKIQKLKGLMKGLTRGQKVEAVNLAKNHGLDIAINYCNTVGRKAN